MNLAPNEILVDARGLEPPEPMERVLAVLARLEPGQAIRMLLHREPFPLYPLLAERGFVHATQPANDGGFVIVIRRRDAGPGTRDEAAGRSVL